MDTTVSSSSLPPAATTTAAAALSSARYAQMTGALVGIALGSLLLFVLGFLVYFYIRRPRDADKPKNAEKAAPSSSHSVVPKLFLHRKPKKTIFGRERQLLTASDYSRFNEKEDHFRELPIARPAGKNRISTLLLKPAIPPSSLPGTKYPSLSTLASDLQLQLSSMPLVPHSPTWRTSFTSPPDGGYTGARESFLPIMSTEVEQDAAFTAFKFPFPPPSPTNANSAGASSRWKTPPLRLPPKAAKVPSLQRNVVHSKLKREMI